MRCEVLAVGTELLLGQIVDTNSAWIGEQLAASGIDSYEHRVIGDNQARIVAALRDLLSRADAVIVCGGLGPTQDDLTRDAIAEVMGVQLVRRMELAEQIAAMFRARFRDMPENKLRQSDIPEGGEAIPNPLGTAPGLLCNVGDNKVVYAVPGVPYEMQEMVRTHVLPDVLQRSGEAAAIVSRSLKTWGTSESALAEMVAPRLDELEELRAILGDLVFGVDDETMEHAVLTRLRARGWTLGVAESVTGGLIGARIVNVDGASEVFKGTIGSYATDVKRSVLGVTAEPVVSVEAAREMVVGARRVLDADVGLAVTGVAGPTDQDGVAVGTVCFGIALADGTVDGVSTRLPGDRERVRQFATISSLNLLRQRLDALGE